MNKASYFKGVFYILLSAFGFAVMNLCVTLAGDLPLFQKALFRNASAAIFSFILFMKSNEEKDWKREDLHLLFFRSFFGTIGLISNYYALDHLLLSDASMLNKLSPFFTLLLSALILKESCNWKQYLLILVAFIGTLFIVKPSFVLSENMVASIIGIIGGFAAGTAYTCVRALGKRRMPGSQIVFFFSLFSTIICIPFVIKDHAPMTNYQVLIMIIASLGATLGQMGITAAYKEAPSKEISIFDYFTVVFSALLGFVFLKQVPDTYSMIGYVVIFISAYLMFLYNKSH